MSVWCQLKSVHVSILAHDDDDQTKYWQLAQIHVEFTLPWTCTRILLTYMYLHVLTSTCTSQLLWQFALLIYSFSHFFKMPIFLDADLVQIANTGGTKRRDRTTLKWRGNLRFNLRKNFQTPLWKASILSHGLWALVWVRITRTFYL